MRAELHDPRVPHTAGPRLASLPGVHAGFHAEFDAGAAQVGGLLHAGETWAGGAFFIRPHEHPVWELYLQAHGVTRWRVGDETFVVAAGGALAVPPGVRHELADRPQARHHFFYAALDVAAAAAPLGGGPELLAPWRAGRVLHSADGGSLAAPFRTLVREVADARVLVGEGLRAAAAMLVVEASRVLTTHPDGDPAPQRRPESPAVRRARELLDHRYGERWRLADLADGSGVSAGHLAELFTRQVGVPPQRYLLERRLERAAELLAGSDLPITTIALDVGFGSGPHFSRAFRAVMRCSPRDYRRSQSGGG